MLVLILLVIVVGAWVQGELKKVDVLVLERGKWEVIKGKRIVERDTYILVAEAKHKQSNNLLQNLQKPLIALKQNVVHLEAQHPVQFRIPGTPVWTKIQLLYVQIAAQQAALASAMLAAQATEKEIRTKKRQIDESIELANNEIHSIDETLGEGYVGQVRTVIYRDLPIAFGVLIGVILVPIGINIFFYYLIAPWASSRRSIRILPLASGPITAVAAKVSGDSKSGAMSAVSKSIVLAENEELIVQSEFLQTISLRSEKKTKGLLNDNFPFSSVLSGMYLLTRVRTTGSDPIVLSSKKDPLIEVGILALSNDAAFVCQPRALVGVIQDKTKPVRITSHWRPGHLQSWLTLQLRFLAFHGPCQLVVKGCRGIRIEPAGTGRLINQAATIGFSANTEYGNIRCETFVPYWRGEQDLFDDIFTGDSGVYVYEEMPSANRHSGITGRGLKGFPDAVLKVFGL